MQLPHKPVVLCILDGFGIAPPSQGNPTFSAKMPVWDKLVDTYPTMALQASSEAVGLPWGEMGNSEVGHLNLGAGRIIYQNLPRISRSIADGSFFKNDAFIQAAEHAKQNKSAMHLMGLIGVGSVHSSTDHLFALMEFCKKQKLKDVYLHIMLDGRDSPRDSGIELMKKVEAKIKELKIGKVATLSGRYYAMDRDNRWDREEKAYRAIAEGVAEKYAKDPMTAIQESYAKEVYDEEVIPTVIGSEDKPTAIVGPKDSLIFFNFRPDRARQITTAFVLPSFDKFKRPQYLKDLLFVSMTQYDKDLPTIVAFPPVEIADPLGWVIAQAGLRQLHIAETEKYAHVTYFFNGGNEKPYEGQENMIVPSPSVSSYDQKPEMSAPKVTERLLKEIKKASFDFIVVNYANCDMVGHTGKFKATVKALEAIDKCLGELVDAVLELDGLLFITADHGNGEELTNLQTGAMDKEHSVNPVPFVAVGREWENVRPYGDMITEHDLSMLQPTGILSDIAVTILTYMQLKPSSGMTGNNLLEV
ncbi:MAG: 2,3-bisphosphoglycerate-independent phosphoglycerate mutase [Patescibacteria group bacterium]|nr:2,3-bisphosphoglycerate-independent phosphoglycerate mutase [Patescibacteria group bacterium]MDD5715190.1 2,3-bisphosphoglycerate-independent phosphoglycerate mutase [Patescibacteria group bacterium]